MKTNQITDEKIISYLTFRLGDEIFAANVSKVINMLEMVKITKIPKAPEYMKGVINLRGTVLPLIDTRIKFEMEEMPITNNTCILVLEINYKKDTMQIGAMVDAVLEVLEFENEDILPPPSLSSGYKNNFIKGMARNNEEFIMILDMDYVFTTDELIDIKQKVDKNAVKPEKTEK